MEFQFRPDQWLEILQHNPVLIVLLAGAAGGMAFTQIIKSLYLAFRTTAISRARYMSSVRLLAVIATYVLTNLLWSQIIGELHSGLRHIVGLTSGLIAPFLYSIVKAAIAVKWPTFAAKLGDNSDTPP